jgi:SAM-dependent methyltransferase
MKPTSSERLPDGRVAFSWGDEGRTVSIAPPGRERSYSTMGPYGGEPHLDMYAAAAMALLTKDVRTVLDVPCGCGYGADLLSKAGWNVVGVDMDESVVEFARNRAPRATIFEGNLLSIGASLGAAFDAVVCVEGIEHVDPEACAVQLAGCLRPGGYLYVTTPDKAQSKGDNPFHVRELTREDLENVLGNAGFDRLKWLSTPDSATLVALARVES